MRPSSSWAWNTGADRSRRRPAFGFGAAPLSSALPYCDRVDDLETRLSAVEQRNRRVDGDKAWETSLTRRALIMAFTYVIVLLYGFAIDAGNPALNAVIPAAGFLLSTVTVPAVKRRWLGRFRSDRD